MKKELRRNKRKDEYEEKVEKKSGEKYNTMMIKKEKKGKLFIFSKSSLLIVRV
jgi:hypothetical protein